MKVDDFGPTINAGSHKNTVLSYMAPPLQTRGGGGASPTQRRRTLVAGTQSES